MAGKSMNKPKPKTVIVTLKGQPRTLRLKGHPPIVLRELKWRGHRQVEIEGLDVEGFGPRDVDIPDEAI